jgi:hypothetical protein
VTVICRSNRRAPGSLTASGGGADPVDGPLRPTARLSAIGRQKYARDKPTVSPSGRSFATSTRATGARLKLCQAQAVGRFPAESYSLPILSFPLQPLRPHNARTRARVGLCRAASAPAAYASRIVLPPSLQSSLPAGWLAFTGRELNPPDRYKRFQITSLVPLFWICPGAREVSFETPPASITRSPRRPAPATCRGSRGRAP